MVDTDYARRIYNERVPRRVLPRFDLLPKAKQDEYRRLISENKTPEELQDALAALVSEVQGEA